MPKQNDAPVQTTGDVVAGLLSIPAEVLANLPAVEYNRSWVVLAQDSAKVRIPTTVDGHTAMADYKVMVTIMRSPVGDEEASKVSDIDAQRKAAQNERDAKAQAERERAIRAASQMATDTTLATVLRLREQVAAGQQAAALASRLGL